MKHPSPSRDIANRTVRARRDVAIRVEDPGARRPTHDADVHRSQQAARRVRQPAQSRAQTGRAGRHVILFLAANPREASLLRLTEECAEIQRELKMTRYRNRFRFESRWAVSIDELMRHLMDLDPTVIHFSGHGCGSAGLMLQDELGEPQLVSARALAMMVAAATDRARVVLLNACYSASQAQELTANIDCVVSMDGAIGDEAARAFAIRFYGAIGNGRSIGNAVQHGIATLAARHLPDELAPQCLTRPGVDAHDLILE